VRPLIKVCGMTLPEQVAAIDALGADFLGFIFAAKSPRRVTPQLVASIPRGRAKRVGVFVEQSAAEVLSIMDAVGLDFAQLHGGQDEAFCRLVGPERVIRAFWPKRHPDLTALESEMAHFADVCAMMLLDAGTSGGGHGQSLVFDELTGINAPRPWLLAGGLSPLNAREALEQARPAGLDINSGVETAPGVKDLDKVAQAIQIIARTK